MVPRAAIHAGSLEPDAAKARAHVRFAMECLRQTFERRRSDILAEPPPPPYRPTGEYIARGPLTAKEQRRLNVQAWEERQARAKAGDVFSLYELLVARSAVQRYAAREEQGGDAVLIAMGRLIHDFPGTPIAAAAQEHLEKTAAEIGEADRAPTPLP